MRWLWVFLLLTAIASAELLEDPIRWEKKTQGQRETIYFRNSQEVPVTIRLTAEQSNTGCDHQLPRLYVIPAKGQTRGPTFWPTDPSRAWRYQTNYYYQFGDHRLTRSEAEFVLPWRSKKTFTCIQGFHGTISHTGRDEYAVDFDMPQGTRITAARRGLVVAIEEQHTETGTTERFRELGNYVVVAHSDGSLTRYYHIRPQGVVVNLGDRVKAGQLLGYSGNTGYSFGPHLHFDVAKPKPDLTYTSIPFQFFYQGKRVTPRQDVRYRP